jgi:hypothetical protein
VFIKKYTWLPRTQLPFLTSFPANP